MPDEERKGSVVRTIAIWLALTIIAALVAELTLGISSKVQEHLSPDRPVSIDFQETRGCPSGRLTDIAGDFENGVQLENGADNLVICHNSKVSAVPSNLPRELARVFPGCLNYASRTLSLMRKSHAVCALPGNAGYLCIGGDAFHADDAHIAKTHTPELCNTDTLKRFGF